MKTSDIEKAQELLEEVRSGKEQLASLTKVRVDGLAAVARQGYGVSITVNVQYADRRICVTLGPEAYEPVLQLLTQHVSTDVEVAEAELRKLGVDI